MGFGATLCACHRLALPQRPYTATMPRPCRLVCGALSFQCIWWQHTTSFQEVLLNKLTKRPFKIVASWRSTGCVPEHISMYAGRRQRDRLQGHALLATWLLRVPHYCLQVASEDTVLYTAQTFVDAITDSRLQAAAKSHLARLVRCPHLSMFWLSALALSPDAPRLLMSAQQDELKQLLMLHHGGLASDCMQQEFNTHLPRVPLSWNLPARASSPVSSVQLVWKLDVAAVASAGRESALKQKCIMLRSPYYTPPLGGLVFDLALYADSSAEPRGSCFAFFAAAKNAPVGTFYKYHISVSIMGDVVLSDNSDMLNSGQDWGRTDTFRLGVMAEGWDEAAWASKGWPTSGELVVSATFKQIAPSAA